MKKVQEDWKEEMLQVGVLTNTHGVRGEVKVYPTTDDVMRFKKLKQVFLDTGKEPMELQVTQARFFKNLVILKFKEFDNINDVEKYKSRGLYVTRENAVKLAPNEYFVADLIGLKAVGDDGEDLGEVKDGLVRFRNLRRINVKMTFMYCIKMGKMIFYFRQLRIV